MKLWLKWIWPFLALCSLCHSLRIYSYKSYPNNLKYENQRDWLKSLAETTPQPEVKSKRFLTNFKKAFTIFFLNEKQRGLSFWAHWGYLGKFSILYVLD